MIRSILAVLAGLAVGLVLIALGEVPTSVMYPLPPGVNYTDSAAMGDYVANLPLQAFLILLAAHAFATFVAGFVAAWIATRAKTTHALVVGLFFPAAAVINLAMLPHPLWVGVAQILLYLPAAYAGSLVAPRPRVAASEVNG